MSTRSLDQAAYILTADIRLIDVFHTDEEKSKESRPPEAGALPATTEHRALEHPLRWHSLRFRGTRPADALSPTGGSNPCQKSSRRSDGHSSIRRGLALGRGHGLIRFRMVWNAGRQRRVDRTDDRPHDVSRRYHWRCALRARLPPDGHDPCQELVGLVHA
ncbi:hypothetical protein L227DRAFT_374105 [Lentinus tigrinus ALCF2SS1-6]|uniref:Uncharacterized protein n=1 Tax=Lentinus tigrinus ALCF2SS1-6 TaxID=1328759 RepID=A0A5C2RTK9_9APHY|nr:hypothetical protein L227DRAFT_374105 [Lentinus tigrinus ALCF2SS1-6]